MYFYTLVVLVLTVDNADGGNTCGWFPVSDIRNTKYTESSKILNPCLYSDSLFHIKSLRFIPKFRSIRTTVSGKSQKNDAMELSNRSKVFMTMDSKGGDQRFVSPFLIILSVVIIGYSTSTTRFEKLEIPFGDRNSFNFILPRAWYTFINLYRLSKRCTVLIGQTFGIPLV